MTEKNDAIITGGLSAGIVEKLENHAKNRGGLTFKGGASIGILGHVYFSRAIFSLVILLVFSRPCDLAAVVTSPASSGRSNLSLLNFAFLYIKIKSYATTTGVRLKDLCLTRTAFLVTNSGYMKS